MHNADEQSGYDSHVQQAESGEDAAEDSYGGSGFVGAISAGDVDLPVFVSNGVVYVQAPLGDILQTVEALFSQFVSGLEAGVSEALSRPFPLTGDGSAFYRPSVDRSRVVRGGGKR